MFNRTVAARVCAICCLAFLVAPDAASARSGGFAAGSGLAVSALPRAGALPLVRPGQVPPVVNAAAALRLHALRLAPGRRLHRFSRHGVPLGGFAYGPYYDPNDYIGAGSALPQTVANTRQVPPGEPVAINGRICFAQTYIVPSEAGGTRPVTVSRC